MSNHKRKNNIKGLRDVNRVWQDLRVGIEGTVIGYFLNIFRSGGILDCAMQEVMRACS